MSKKTKASLEYDVRARVQAEEKLRMTEAENERLRAQLAAPPPPAAAPPPPAPPPPSFLDQLRKHPPGSAARALAIAHATPEQAAEMHAQYRAEEGARASAPKGAA